MIQDITQNQPLAVVIRVQQFIRIVQRAIQLLVCHAWPIIFYLQPAHVQQHVQQVIIQKF